MLLAGGAALAAAVAPGCGPLAIEHPLPLPLAEDQHERPSPAPGWPAFLGPEGTCVSAETGLHFAWPESGPSEKWRIAIGSGYSSPVADGDDLVLLQRVGNREVVLCYDAETGQEKWRHGWPTTFQCKYEYTSGPYGTPRIDGPRIYAAGAQAQLCCLDRITGQPLWQRSLADDFALAPGLFGFGPGLLTDDERLYLNAGGVSRQAGIVALDKLTGETLWTATEHAMAYTMPRLATLHGRPLLLVLTEVGLVALDPASGREHWTVPYHSKAIDTMNAVTPLVQDDLLLLVAGPGPGATCLRVPPEGSPQEVWQDRRRLDSQFNQLVQHNGHVYGFTSRRQGGSQFRCLELATGRQRWEYASDLGRGQAIAADGCLIVLGEHGHLAALDLNPERLVVRSATPGPVLPGPCYASPALHRGLLYLRNETTLLCLSVRT
jgi:outer membrane protein assembly factor BamB